MGRISYYIHDGAEIAEYTSDHFDEDKKFPKYPKTQRLENETITISEKIDGTNGLIRICPAPWEGGRRDIIAGSRSKWLIPGKTRSWDNHGFGQWVEDNRQELYKLPDGDHYGEWYGRGINRGYGLKEKRFMLFNRDRYGDLEDFPNGVEVETVLSSNIGVKELSDVLHVLTERLMKSGSEHVPGFAKPEGVILRFKLAGKVYKQVFDYD